jgi:hypothetical protein
MSAVTAGLNTRKALNIRENYARLLIMGQSYSTAGETDANHVCLKPFGDLIAVIRPPVGTPMISWHAAKHPTLQTLELRPHLGSFSAKALMLSKSSQEMTDERKLSQVIIQCPWCLQVCDYVPNAVAPSE